MPGSYYNKEIRREGIRHTAQKGKLPLYLQHRKEDEEPEHHYKDIRHRGRKPQRIDPFYNTDNVVIPVRRGNLEVRHPPEKGICPPRSLARSLLEGSPLFAYGNTLLRIALKKHTPFKYVGRKINYR